jgi:hypothetical protein
MLAPPWPLVALRVIHESFELADHAHSRSVFTTRLPFPPDAAISGGLLVIDTAQRVVVGALTVVVAEPPHAVNTATTRRGHSCRGEGIGPPHMVVCTGQRVGLMQTQRREQLRLPLSLANRLTDLID